MGFPIDEIEGLLTALGEHLAARGAAPVELVVCGVTAMNALGFVKRPTKDVDVVALLESVSIDQKQLVTAAPLPESVQEARRRVALDFGVTENWLNDDPADLMRFGLPEGCEQRLVARSFGPLLTVHFLGRFDLICLKLYAWSDTGTPRHGQDLKALNPTEDELLLASRWVLTHNEPEGFLPLLQQALCLLGADDVARNLD